MVAPLQSPFDDAQPKRSAQVPDYFALYGIAPTFSPDAAALRRQYYALSRQYHPDRIGNDAAALQKASEINEGYRVLGDRNALMGYILRLQGVVEEEEQYKLPPEFLMEMMELNEAVGNVQMAPDMLPEAQREADAAFAAWDASVAPLVRRFDEGERSPDLLMVLKDFYYRRKYLLRIKARLD